MIRASRWIALVSIWGAAACANQATGPQPGTLSVKLQNPNDGADGAIVLTLTGPVAPSNVVAAPGDTLWGGPFTGTTNKIVLTGNIRTGAILTFSVPDVKATTQWVVGVNQVAASSGYALRALSNYALGVTQ
jgi:hypothetical protein